jgi:hypothetical protein
MRTDRAYRKALPHEAAVAESVANAGHQFDPQVVEAFLRMIERDDPAINEALGRMPTAEAARSAQLVSAPELAKRPVDHFPALGTRPIRWLQCGRWSSLAMVRPRSYRCKSNQTPLRARASS